MGKGQKHLEGKSQRERQKVRKKLGSLKSLTIQPRTRVRYDKAKDKFYDFLSQNGLQIPRAKWQMDNLLCEYLEFLWSSGEGRGLASDTLASLQDTNPGLRGSIPGAWRLLKTWHVHEIPNRVSEPAMALSLLLGYYGMLCTGEVLAIRNQDVIVDDRQRTAVVSLGFTKGGKRSGAAESITVHVSEVIRRLVQWKQATKPGSYLSPPAHIWRKKFNEALESLGFQEWEFRPYSLRRGGATFWFSRHGSLDKILLQGRWMAARTARIYLNEGLSVLTQIKIPTRLVHCFFKRYPDKPSALDSAKSLSVLVREVQGDVEDEVLRECLMANFVGLLSFGGTGGVIWSKVKGNQGTGPTYLGLAREMGVPYIGGIYSPSAWRGG